MSKGEEPIHAKKGDSLFVHAGETYTIEALADVTLFKAAVPG